MPFVHFALMPSIFILLSIMLHYWLDQKEFNQFFKIFFLGLAAGLIIITINYFLKFTYIHSAHILTVILKSALIDGLLFAALTAAALYFIFDRILGIQLTITWSITSIMILSFFLGLFSIINIAEIFTKNYPDNLLYYLAYMPMILLITLILGYGLPKYMDSTELLGKILWASFSIGITAAVCSYFYLVKFYNNILLYLIIIPFAITAVLFEIYDFRQFRT